MQKTAPIQMKKMLSNAVNAKKKFNQRQGSITVLSKIVKKITIENAFRLITQLIKFLKNDKEILQN